MGRNKELIGLGCVTQYYLDHGDLARVPAHVLALEIVKQAGSDRSRTYIIEDNEIHPRELIDRWLSAAGDEFRESREKALSWAIYDNIWSKLREHDYSGIVPEGIPSDYIVEITRAFGAKHILNHTINVVSPQTGNEEIPLDLIVALANDDDAVDVGRSMSEFYYPMPNENLRARMDTWLHVLNLGIDQSCHENSTAATSTRLAIWATAFASEYSRLKGSETKESFDCLIENMPSYLVNECRKALNGKKPESSEYRADGIMIDAIVTASVLLDNQAETAHRRVRSKSV